MLELRCPCGSRAAVWQGLVARQSLVLVAVA